jgi:small subunit ribosomal protein S20
MANNKSAIKRIRTSERKRVENAPYKSLVKTFIKKYFKVLETYEVNPTEENFTIVKTFLSLAYSKIDKAKKKKILHQNNASRKKSRLGKALVKIQLNKS